MRKKIFEIGLIILVGLTLNSGAAQNQRRKPVAGSQPQSAAAAAQSKCDAGQASACFSLGEMYRDGEGVGKDLATAVNLFGRACDGSLAEACEYLGWLYKHKDEVGKDEARAAGFYARAVTLWEAGCERQDLKQCVSLGEYYRYNKNDKPKAAAAYGKACAAGMLAACTEQGHVLYLNLHTDYALAAELFKKACDGGEAGGCGYLGMMYRDGDGVPQDLILAARLLTKGCDGGHGVDCNFAGVLYARGWGVVQDSRTAFDLFKKGCEMKRPDSTACTNLAMDYEVGGPVPKDLEKARKLYAIGCADEYNPMNEYACKKLKELSP